MEIPWKVEEPYIFIVEVLFIFTLLLLAHIFYLITLIMTKISSFSKYFPFYLDKFFEVYYATGMAFGHVIIPGIRTGRFELLGLRARVCGSVFQGQDFEWPDLRAEL